jgi:pyrophosphatase PpaX
MRTILFDFDGTVADTLPLIFTAFRSTFQQFLHRRYADEEIVAMFGPTETGILQAMIPPDQVEQALDHFFRVYAEGHRHVHNPAEIALMLDRLRETGIVMGIVTGKGRRSADISLQAWGLARYFDVVITGDDVSRPKPDPEGILAAMERLGARAEQTRRRRSCGSGRRPGHGRRRLAACHTKSGPFPARTGLPVYRPRGLCRLGPGRAKAAVTKSGHPICAGAPFVFAPPAEGRFNRRGRTRRYAWLPRRRRCRYA